MFHQSALRRSFGADDPLVVMHPDFLPQPPLNEQEIESILGPKDVMIDGKKERFFRIFWKGEREEESTWEAEHHLHNTRQMVATYLIKQGRTENT